MFGVEVTELFENESMARLSRKPNYFNIHSPDNEQIREGLQGIIVEKKPHTEIIADLATLINRKQVSIATAELNHTNLIVRDTTNFLRYTDKDKSKIYMHLYFKHPNLFQTVLNSPFREIFLVCDAGEKLGYIRLKMLLLLAEFKLFNHCSVANALPVGQELHEQLHSFALYLASRTSSPVLVRPGDRVDEVIFGDCGVGVGEDSIKVTDYQDAPYPADAACVSKAGDPEILLLNRYFDDFREANTFVSLILLL